MRNSNEYGNAVYVFGVYSYKRYFDLQQDMKALYEVKDLDVAGLDRRSFVDVSRFIRVKTAKLRTYKHLGHLSERDKAGLYAKARKYYDQSQLDDFLKTLDH
jgi:hypothetical protein